MAANNFHSPVDGVHYVTIAANQAAQALTPTVPSTSKTGVGNAGDYLSGLLIVPATTGPGTVSIQDGSGSAINVFVSGTLPSTASFFVPIMACSVNGAWSVTTGANVSVIATGQFS